MTIRTIQINPRVKVVMTIMEEGVNEDADYESVKLTVMATQ